MKQKQYCNKLSRNFNNHPHQKKKPLKIIKTKWNHNIPHYIVEKIKVLHFQSEKIFLSVFQVTEISALFRGMLNSKPSRFHSLISTRRAKLLSAWIPWPSKNLGLSTCKGPNRCLWVSVTYFSWKACCKPALEYPGSVRQKTETCE